MQIVVGIDGSRSAESAVAWAVEAAEQTGAELLFVSVIPPGWEREATERLLIDEWTRVAQLAEVPFRTEILVGDARQQLVGVAGEVGADLVVVGAGQAGW